MKSSAKLINPLDDTIESYPEYNRKTGSVWCNILLVYVFITLLVFAVIFFITTILTDRQTWYGPYITGSSFVVPTSSMTEAKSNLYIRQDITMPRDITGGYSLVHSTPAFTTLTTRMLYATGPVTESFSVNKGDFTIGVEGDFTPDQTIDISVPTAQLSKTCSASPCSLRSYCPAIGGCPATLSTDSPSLKVTVQQSEPDAVAAMVDPGTSSDTKYVIQPGDYIVVTSTNEWLAGDEVFLVADCFIDYWSDVLWSMFVGLVFTAMIYMIFLRGKLSQQEGNLI